MNAQGEDVVAGIRNTEPLAAMKDRFPGIYDELLQIFERLEKHYRDMCDTEFTIEQGKLWMLQTRVGKRTGLAALRMAVEMTEDPDIGLSHEDAVMRVTAEHLESLLHPEFAIPTSELQVIATGLAASPGRGRSGRSTSRPTTPPPPPTGARRSSSSATRRRPRTCTG